MAKLTKEEVEHIAKLARIELTPEEVEKFQTQLSSVLDYIDQLKEVDTENVEPTAQVAGLENVLREDAVAGCDKETRARILENVPEREGDLVKVKAVFE